MKNSIIYLGIALVLCISSNGTNITKSNQDLHQLHNSIGNEIEKENFSKKKTNTDKEKNLPTIEENTVFYPETVLGAYQPKSIQEIIAENNIVIESNATNDFYPLDFDNLIGEQIAQDNAIIDSKITNDFQPLDFEIINSI